MDFTEYIRIFNKEQKGQFTSFCLQLPLIFTVLYLYNPQFKEIDLYVQIIFSITASILTLFFFDIFLIFYYRVLKISSTFVIILPTIPVLFSSSYLILSVDLYQLGYQYALHVYMYSLFAFVVFFMGIGIFIHIFNRFHRNKGKQITGKQIDL